MIAIIAVMLFITAATAKVFLEYAEQIAEVPGGETIPVDLKSFLLGFSSASMFSMLTSIFVSIVVCEDYDGQIIKNVYARGYSRAAHYFTKLIYVLVTTSLMFLAAVVLAAVFGGAMLGFGALSGKVFALICGQYVVCMSGVALGFFIASSIKKLGASIAINIIAPSVLSLLLELADTALKLEDFKVSDLWTASFLTSLMSTDITTGRFIACVLGSVAYGVAFILAGYAINKKTEV